MWHFTRLFFFPLLTLSQALFAQEPEPPSAKYFLKEIVRFDSLDAVEPDPKGAILFTGSSSIRLWATIREDLNPYPVIPRGFGGARIEDVNWYLERIMDPHQFRAIVFMAGSNNITGGEQDWTEAAVLAHTRLIIGKVRNRYPGAPIFWIAITPTLSRINVIDKVRSMNRAWKKDFRGLSNVYFIDTQKAFLDQSGRPRSELFIGDQLHLNREGYRIWGRVIKKSLDRHLK